jgi:outer membrane immunogenic protein
MKTVLLSSVALAVLITAPAMAADLPGRPVYKAAPAVAITNWTGLYVGAHVGYGNAVSTWTFDQNGVFNSAPGQQFISDPAGWLGGAQIGVNYQTGSWVFGVEGTWSAANINKTINSPDFPVNDTETTQIKSLYTVAFRAGYLITDRWLTHFKFGWAGGEEELSAHTSFLGGTNWNPGTQTRSGFMFGSGTDYMLTPNWIVGFEYDYIDLGTKHYSANNTGAQPTLTSLDDKTTKVQTIVGRLSYLLNWGGR